MQAVGRLGSYISKSVYTVSGPFHPFGGAVDIIVVEQPDGSYKSSPWYVRFGKFQGVLKTKEKVVSIGVNGVEADFHMYLDHKGEAFFLKEVDVEERESASSPPSPPSSCGEDTDGQPGNRWPLKSKSCNYDSNLSDSIGNERKAVTRANSRRSQIFGLFGRRSSSEEGIQVKENASDVVRTESLELAEIAADLLDLKWSTNLASPRRKKDNASLLSAAVTSKDEIHGSFPIDGSSHDETGHISQTSYQELESTVEENGVEMKCLTSEYIVKTATSVESVREDTTLSISEPLMTDTLGLGKSDFHVSSVSIVTEVAKSDSQIQDSVEKLNSLSDTSFSKEDNARDDIQSFYSSEVSESSVVGLDESSEQKNNSFSYGGCGEVCGHTGTVQNMTQSICMVKSEPERDLMLEQETLDIQQRLGKEDQFSFIHEEKMSVSEGTTYGASESIVTECYSQLVCLHQPNEPLKDIDSLCIAAASGLSYSTCSPIDEQNVLGEKNKHESSAGLLCDPQISICNFVPPCIEASRIAEEELLLFGNLDGFGSTDAKHLELSHSDHEGKEADSSFPSRVADGVNESSDAKCCSGFSLDQSVIDDYINDAGLQRRRLRSISSDDCINETDHVHSEELTRMARSLPSMAPLSNNLEASDPGHSSNPSLYPSVNSDTDKNHQSPGTQTTAEDVKILKESKEETANPSIGSPTSMESLGGSGRNWPFPFKRSRGMKVSHVDMNGSENPNGLGILNNSSDLERGADVTKVKINEKIVKTLTPTSEQLATLNLKEGKNIVIFTFSTTMLGKQQVDARIFLWRWDTRIVISDVDGTITRSDLLGQVMPLVGMDWSQTGVAHLFSAIKENGYQLLFLSARSISQSFVTRQFLFNIKQDGKALPEGPVVISPDGLFPSLFREVVRRAPHEFKIACLEDIKALFPVGTNPFYAGFGNRDTDEFSYLKVGIPRGKIFIINPKGEIAVNRRVDTKSYLALHALVHGMFPTMLTCEQEDFNSWNYWKLPPPIIDL